MFTTITPPAAVPVTLEDVKLQLALSTNEFDGLLMALIYTAVELATTDINGSIIDTEKEFYTSAWCGSNTQPYQPFVASFGSIRVPHGRIHTVSKVEYRTYDGVWHELDVSLWDWSNHFGQVLIFPKPNTFFPAVALYPVLPIRVTFVAGFGADRESVPDAIKHAIRMTACYLFERRDDAPQAMPDAAKYLLANHRCVTQEMF